jgi:hypothetical protein
MTQCHAREGVVALVQETRNMAGISPLRIGSVAPQHPFDAAMSTLNPRSAFRCRRAMEKRKPSRQRRGGEGAFGEGGTRRVPEKKGGDEFRPAFQPRGRCDPGPGLLLPECQDRPCNTIDPCFSWTDVMPPLPVESMPFGETPCRDDVNADADLRFP